MAQDPHRDRRENPGNSGGGAHHQRRRRCRAGERHRFECTGEGCCRNFWTRSRPIRRSPVSPPPLVVCMQTTAGPRTVPLTPASAMMPLPPAARLRSSRPARTPDPGRQTALGRSRATRPCAHRNGWVGRSGDDGEALPTTGSRAAPNAITAGAASKRRCTVSNCLGQRLAARDFDRQVARVPDPCGRPERLHRARHTRHKGRRMSLSGERGTPAIN